MCGILGSVNFDNTSEYLNLIQHRGPDASGIQSFDIGEHSVSLLHRRLSIVDLSEAGSQPMSACDNNASIIFNGEIYNHLELKKKLPHISFRGHSDTETIVNYLRHFSIVESLSCLNGIFALAYLDVQKKKLFLARDRFGVKPLYYYFDGNRLMFSSEIRPIKSYIKSAINRGVAFITLRMRYSPSPLTVFDEIKKVEPGQLISFDLCESVVKVSKEYFVKGERLGTRKDEFKKLVNIYGDLFESAVERQLMADVDIGILLSGGVDSALVAAIAQKRSAKKLKAFTIGFEGDHKEIDEISYARETAEILGLDHYDQKINFPNFLTSIKQIAQIVEEPIATTSIIPMYFLSQLAVSHVKVVLSGQGADEPLGGYNKYRALPYLEKIRFFRKISSPLDKIDFVYKNKEHLRRFLKAIQPEDLVSSWMEYCAISSQNYVANIVNPKTRKQGLNEMQQYQTLISEIWKSRTPNNSELKDLFLYYDLRTSLADDLLMYTDKITMNFGLECRVPILDNSLIAFIESLDSKYKYNSRKGKIIHKAFAQEYLPGSIINRKKIGFKSPTEIWFRENRNELENIFMHNSAFLTMFNQNKVREILNRHKEGENLEKQIFHLLSLNYLFNN
ncbi:asparagine synthase (glutamine-hydrolyzing) [Pricia sp. S334]|uniref:asparagine synthase (glutamine-hydrolyzing) n=1 Tax=Pricia mediterranea TaxID=3076079 RepID=A0ABU3L2W4_9FLAO|nr:asparagine synthase (glutamine-hydrolyzing) [Pricia sp. S334]MDT7828079.1 asparagine synthase (glutamine-hydrolyzing) [Pricia sp. S334]